MQRGRLIVVVLVMFCGVTTSVMGADPQVDASVSLMRGVIDRFNEDREALERYHNIESSQQRRERFRTFYESTLKELQEVDFDRLDGPGRIDYLLLRNLIGRELKELKHNQQLLDEIGQLIPFAPTITRLEEDRRRMLPQDAEQSARTLAELSKAIAAVAKNDLPSSDSNQARILAHRASRITEQLRGTLRRWNTFYAGYDPAFTWWTREPYEKADKALQEYAGKLRRQVRSDGEDDPVIGDPIGRQALLDALAAEMIPYTPEELIEIANREFAWCEKEMKRAADDLGFDGDWHKALDHVSSIRMKPGEQPKLIKELADEAVKFVEDRKLVTVPALAKETWRMEMMPPERQKVNPYFTGGEVISVSFPTDSMDFEDRMMSLRGNNAAFCRATVHHELIPGHHLQLFMAERYNTHRKLFRTPFLVEGWALYWEMLLWDLGFARTAEDRVGMLFWRSHRCARIIFSLKYHLGEMTPQEAIDFLVSRVGHERRNATAEVRRSVAGAYPPLYQAAYMLGGLQIRALRREVVDSGRMSDRDFHDAILKQNAIPIEMIRAQLLSQALSSDFSSNWRFYDLAAPDKLQPTDSAR